MGYGCGLGEALQDRGSREESRLLTEPGASLYRCPPLKTAVRKTFFGPSSQMRKLGLRDVDDRLKITHRADGKTRL